MTTTCLQRLALRSRGLAAWIVLATTSSFSLGCAASGAMMEAPAAPREAPAAQMGAPAEAAGASAPVADAAPNVASPAQGRAPSRAPGPIPPSPSPSKGQVPTTSARGAKEVDATKVDATAPDVEQMIIFTGGLDLMVAKDDFGNTLNEVIEQAAKRGGYIHQQTDQSVTVRVPSGRFRETMKALEKLGEVTHRSVQAQDVSEKYFDLGVRLKSLLATRDRLERFLQRAKTIEEVLRVEQELRRLNTEIDKLQGQRRYLAAQAAYSTITVSLQPKPEPQVVVAEDDEDVKPPPPPPPKTLVLPIDWLGDTSLERLLELNKD
jgi:hypothetical protein